MNAQRDWHSEPEQPNETAEISQPDPVLQEGKAGPVRIMLYAVGAIVILGAVFYGLNRPAPEDIAAHQGASSTASSAPPEQPTPTQDEATKSGAADNNPSANVTTGAAPKDGKPDQSKAGARPDKAQ